MKLDVAIVGGGVVGGSLACALAGSGLRIALVEPRQPKPLPVEGFDARVYALSPRSRRFLEAIGAWQHLDAGRVTPVYRMYVFGDGKTSRLEFDAYRSHVPELASIVEEANLQQALACALAGHGEVEVLAGVGCNDAQWSESDVRLTLSDGRHIEAALVAAADGAQSGLRATAGIDATFHSYGQQGVVANFQAQSPHRGVARQWFVDDGVLALLPLPENHLSMVWSTSDRHAAALLAMTGPQLAGAVQAAARGEIAGLAANGPARAFPLQRMRASRVVGDRLALLGDAAHNVHPLAGQGLNLGVGDAESLALVLKGRGMNADCGSPLLLRAYERSRKEEMIAMEHVTDGLHALFDSRNPVVVRLRNLGLVLTDRLPPLKQMLVKRALG